MGNQKSRSLQKEADHIKSDLTPEGRQLVENVFATLAARSGGGSDQIDRAAFIKFYSNIEQVFWKDRLFDVFDFKKTGFMNFDEFLVSYVIFSSNSSSASKPSAKLKFLFAMFANGDMRLDRPGLTQFIEHLPDAVLEKCESYVEVTEDGGIATDTGPGCVERMVNHAFGGHEEKTVNFSDSEDSEQTDEKGGQVLSKGKKSIGFKTFLEWAHHYHMVAEWADDLHNETAEETEMERKSAAELQSYAEEIEGAHGEVHDAVSKLEREHRAMLDAARARKKLARAENALRHKKHAVRKIVKLCRHVQYNARREAFEVWAAAVYRSAASEFVKIRNRLGSSKSGFFPNLAEKQRAEPAWVKTAPLGDVATGKVWERRGLPRYVPKGHSSKMDDERRKIEELSPRQRKQFRLEQRRNIAFGRFLVTSGRAIPRIFRCSTASADYPIFHLPSHTTAPEATAQLPKFTARNHGLFGAMRRQELMFGTKSAPERLCEAYIQGRTKGNAFLPLATRRSKAGDSSSIVSFDDAHHLSWGKMEDGASDDNKTWAKMQTDMYANTLVPVDETVRWKFKVGSLVHVDLPVDAHAIAEEFGRVIGLIVYDYCAVWDEHHDELHGKGHDTGVHPEHLLDVSSLGLCEAFLSEYRSNQNDQQFELNGPLYGFQSISESIKSDWQRGFALKNLDPMNSFPDTILLTIVVATLSGPRSKGLNVEKQLCEDRAAGRDTTIDINVQATAEEKQAFALMKQIMCAKLALMVLSGGTINYTPRNERTTDATISPSQDHHLGLLSSIVNHSIMTCLQPMFADCNFRSDLCSAKIVKMHRCKSSRPTPISLALGGRALLEHNIKRTGEAPILKRHSRTREIERDGFLADTQTPDLGDWVYELRYDERCNVWGKRDPRVTTVSYDRLTPLREDLIKEHSSDPDKLLVNYEGMETRPEGEDKTGITVCVFGSKRQLLRSALDRWLARAGGNPCEAFLHKLHRCADSESIVRRLHRFQKKQKPRKASKKSDPEKGSMDILKYINARPPAGWDIDEARDMYTRIYVGPAKHSNATDAPGKYGLLATDRLVKDLGELDLELKNVLLPRQRLWEDRLEGAQALEQQLLQTVTKQTQLLNSRLPGSSATNAAMSFEESLGTNHLEANMTEIQDEIDAVAKEREHWRQKVIQYQLILDQMVTSEKGMSMHELVQRDQQQFGGLHSELKRNDLTWELTG